MFDDAHATFFVTSAVVRSLSVAVAVNWRDWPGVMMTAGVGSTRMETICAATTVNRITVVAVSSFSVIVTVATPVSDAGTTTPDGEMLMTERGSTA